MLKTSKNNKTAFCFDMDGTITRTEVLPCIASELGIADEIAALTNATMNGHIEFEPSFRLRCLLLGQIDPFLIEKVVKAIPLDKTLLSFISKRRKNCFIVTGNLDIWIKPILNRCGCLSFSSTGSYLHGKLQLKTVLNKAHALKSIRKNMNYDFLVAIGDGANDAPMLHDADVGIAYGGVHPASTTAIQASNYIINDGVALCSLLKTL